MYCAAKKLLFILFFRYVEPPDGGWGWVIVAAVWVDNMLVLGMLKSFGVLFPAFRSYFQENASAISWINSISLSMRATAGGRKTSSIKLILLFFYKPIVNKTRMNVKL